MAKTFADTWLNMIIYFHLMLSVMYVKYCAFACMLNVVPLQAVRHILECLNVSPDEYRLGLSRVNSFWYLLINELVTTRVVNNTVKKYLWESLMIQLVQGITVCLIKVSPIPICGIEHIDDTNQYRYSQRQWHCCNQKLVWEVQNVFYILI